MQNTKYNTQNAYWRSSTRNSSITFWGLVLKYKTQHTTQILTVFYTKVVNNVLGVYSKRGGGAAERKVRLCVYVPVCLSVVCLCVCVSDLGFSASLCLCVSVSLYLYISVSVCVSVFIWVYGSVGRRACVSVYPSVYQSICLYLTWQALRPAQRPHTVQPLQPLTLYCSSLQRTATQRNAKQRTATH